jgi:polyisoprenoid-binding protein YceI
MPWTIDKAHTRIGFSVKHMMVSTVHGEFKSYSGTIELDAQDLTRSRVSGEIEVASIDTGNSDRDNHLRANDFFDAPNHPTISFRSTRLERLSSDTFKVFGDLTIRGVTREVELEAEYAGQHKNPWGKTSTGFTVTGTINRKDFGMDFNMPLETGGLLVGEKVKIQLDIEAVLEEAPVAAAAAN